MNTNIILDGFTAILNQLIATAVAEAIKPLQDRITALEEAYTEAYTDWKGMEHVAAKAVRNVLDGYNFISRNDVVDLVDKVVENAIDAYDFSDSIDWDNKIEEGINNYDFSNIDISGAIEEGIENYDFSGIIQEMLPDELDKDVVQQMIDESLDNLSISRN
jgi:hypothetical protein